MKPHVICHMAASVDRRTLHSRWRPDGALAGALFAHVNDEHGGDAWLIGRVTGQEFAKGNGYPATTNETFHREARLAPRDAKAYGVVLDAHGKIVWGRSDIGGASSSPRALGRSPQRGRLLHLRRRDRSGPRLGL